jgi:hypothetical protein
MSKLTRRYTLVTKQTTYEFSLLTFCGSIVGNVVDQGIDYTIRSLAVDLVNNFCQCGEKISKLRRGSELEDESVDTSVDTSDGFNV